MFVSVLGVITLNPISYCINIKSGLFILIFLLINLTKRVSINNKKEIENCKLVSSLKQNT